MTNHSLKTCKIALFLLIIFMALPIPSFASSYWFQISSSYYGTPYFRVGYSTSSYLPFSYRYSYPWYYRRGFSHSKVARDTKVLEKLLVAKKDNYDAIKREEAAKKLPAPKLENNPQIHITPSPLEMIPKETIKTGSVVINYY
jgi:hypothetical protein